MSSTFCQRENAFSQYTSAFASAIATCQCELERLYHRWKLKGKKTAQRQKLDFDLYAKFGIELLHKLALQKIGKIRYWTAGVLSCLWCKEISSLILFLLILHFL